MLKRIAVIFIFLLTTSCGYEIMYSKKKINDYDFSIKDITLTGDSYINLKIKQKLNNYILNQKNKVFGPFGYNRNKLRLTWTGGGSDLRGSQIPQSQVPLLAAPSLLVFHLGATHRLPLACFVPSIRGRVLKVHLIYIY